MHCKRAAAGANAVCWRAAMRPNFIAAARAASHLDAEIFGRLCDLDAERLTALETGESPTSAEVDRCARLLGLRVRDLLDGAAEQSPMKLLLRSAYEQGRPSLDELDATGAHRALGEFLRAVRDVAELEQLLGLATTTLPTLAVTPAPPGVHPAEREARRWRERLNLGIAPIPSMVAVLEQLGVRVFFTHPDELDQSVDGASTTVPRAAVLVNLVDGGSCWWATRMTLAHELSHLLLDRSRGATWLSPHRRPLNRPKKGWRWQLFDGFDDLEVHADAFAACFLAPEEGVRRCVGTLDPRSEGAIGAVGGGFGVGRTVAINRLQHVFHLSREARAEMESRPPTRYQADFPGDRVEPGSGMRSGVMRELVRQALEANVIGRVRAAEYLGVPLTEELPLPGLAEPLRRPVLGRERWALALAQKHLALGSDAGWLHALRAEPDEAGWRVVVGFGGVGDELAPAGDLLLDGEGRVVADRTRRPAA